MEITPPVKLHITMTIPADSAVEVERILLTAQEEPQDLVDNCSPDNHVSSNYPRLSSPRTICICVHLHIPETVSILGMDLIFRLHLSLPITGISLFMN